MSLGLFFLEPLSASERENRVHVANIRLLSGSSFFIECSFNIFPSNAAVHTVFKLDSSLNMVTDMTQPYRNTRTSSYHAGGWKNISASFVFLFHLNQSKQKTVLCGLDLLEVSSYREVFPG